MDVEEPDPPWRYVSLNKTTLKEGLKVTGGLTFGTTRITIEKV